MLEVTQSQIKSWRSCQMKHYYNYFLGLEKKKKSIQLERGSILHEMLEAFLLGESWEKVLEGYTEKFNKMFAEERVDLGDLPGDARKMMEGYIAHWAEEPLNPLVVEKVVGPIQLTSKTSFKGKVDAVVVDKLGKQWLVEHKSHKDFPKEDIRLLNMQTVLYSWALGEEGIPVEGILWDYIRTKPPTKPDILVKGGVSRRKDIDTTYQVYLDTVLEAGCDPDDYKDMLDKLKQRTDAYYRRIPLPVSKRMMLPMVEDLKKTSLEIYYLQDKPSRNPGIDCGWCSYYALCTAELRGLDTEFIIQHEYKPKEDNRYESKEASKNSKPKNHSIRRPDKADKTRK